MGRIKTQQVKSITQKLIREHGNEFTEDFTKNKAVFAKFAKVSSRKIRNVIAGYATRLVRMKRVKSEE